MNDLSSAIVCRDLKVARRSAIFQSVLVSDSAEPYRLIWASQRVLARCLSMDVRQRNLAQPSDEVFELLQVVSPVGLLEVVSPPQQEVPTLTAFVFRRRAGSGRAGLFRESTAPLSALPVATW